MRSLIGSVAAIVALGLLAVAGYVWNLGRSVDNNLGRVHAFEGAGHQSTDNLGKGRAPLNLLFVGTVDPLRAGGPVEEAKTVSMIHIPAARDKVYVVSVPRDSVVDGPAGAKAKLGRTLRDGGMPTFVRTAERVFGAPVDHVVNVGFSGFKQISAGTPGARGAERDGRADDTLRYLRQVRDLPRGDLDRIGREQQVARDLFTRTLGARAATDPAGLVDLLSRSTVVDEGFTVPEMGQLFGEIASLRSEDVVFLTAPVALARDLQDPEKATVQLDDAGMRNVSQLLGEDRTQHPSPALM